MNIPILYDKNTNNFNGEGLGRLTDTVEDILVTENASGFFELEMVYSLDTELSAYIIEGNFIYSHTSERDDDMLKFTIYSVEPDYTEGLLYVNARLTLLDIFMKSVVPEGLYNRTGTHNVLNNLKTYIYPTYDFTVTGSDNLKFYLEHEETTVYDIIYGTNGLVEQTGVTLRFYDNGIQVTSTRGNQQPVEITERDFLEQFKIKESRENMVTRIIPYTTLMKDVTTKEDDRWTKDTNENKVYGTPVLSQNIAKGYPVVTRYVEYRNEITGARDVAVDGDTIELNIYKYEEIGSLNTEALSFFSDNPSIDEYEITTTIESLGFYENQYGRLESLALYDKADIYIAKHQKLVQTEVTEVVHNVTIGRNTSLRFETAKVTIKRVESVLNSGKVSQKELSNIVANQNQNIKVTNSIINAQGNRVSFVTTLPPVSSSKEGDVAFLEKDDKVELWEFKDGVWAIDIVVSNDRYVKDKINEAYAEAEQAKAEADNARQRAEDALAEAGISSDLSQTAKDLADTAKSNAQTALTNAQSALNQAGVAANQAVQAINTADTAKTNAQTALTNAQTALTEAGNAKTTANNLTVRVDDVEAEIELKANQTIVDGLSGTVSTQGTTLTQHAGLIASKANSSLVNTIKGTVDTHSTEISQNATEIASKASASSVNTLTGRVSTAETTITQQAGLIASKANQTEVDTVKGTVSSHTSTLSQHATAIQARLTSTEVNNLVDGKGLAKVTYVDNQISATADGIGVELNKLSDLSIKNKFSDRYFKDGLGGWVSDHADVTVMHGNGNMRIVVLASNSSGKRIYNAMDGFEKGRVFHFSFTLSGLSDGLVIVGQGGVDGETIEFQRINGTVNCTGTFLSNGYALSIYFPNSGTMEIRNMLVYETSGVTTLDMTRVNMRADGLDLAITNLNSDLSNNYATKTYANTQIDIKAGEINQSLSAIEGRLDANLIDLVKLASDKITNDNNPTIWSYVFNGKPNTTYTLSTNIPARGTAYDLFMDRSSLNPSSASNGLGKDKPKTLTTDSTGILTIGIRKDTEEALGYITLKDILGGRYWIILAQGSQAKTFADSFASVRVNELSTTVDGWRNTISYVSDNRTKINETISSVDSYKQTIGSNGEKIAQMVMTDSLFQNAISDFSRAKQLITNGNFASGFNGWIFDGNSTYTLNSDSTVSLNYASIDGESRIYNNSFRVVQGVTYTIKIRARTLSTATIKVGPTGATADIVLSQDFKTYSVSVAHPSIAYVISIYKANREGSVIIDYIEVYEEGGGVTTSQVTQLANNWAVRMLNSKNDVISQINLSDSTFLIEAKNIVGLGNAVINGKLTVTEDMIAGTISANKISTGTLNASNVNIVNLNASNIATGTLTSILITGPNLSINLGTGEVNFEKGVIGSTNTQWDLTKADFTIYSKSPVPQASRTALIMSGTEIKMYDNMRNIAGVPDTQLAKFGASRVVSSGSSDSWAVMQAFNWSTNKNEYMQIGSHGQVIISGLKTSTSSGSANVFVNVYDGHVYRSTSARKYKTDIRIADDVIFDAKKVLEINPVSWLDKAQLAETGSSDRYYGFIADDFDDLGLTQVVSYSLGEVESLNYERLSMYHNVILSEHEQKIIELENRIEELESQLSA